MRSRDDGYAAQSNLRGGQGMRPETVSSLEEARVERRGVLNGEKKHALVATSLGPDGTEGSCLFSLLVSYRTLAHL